MEKLGLNEIREKYLSFFESKGHLRLPSFSLVPQNDPSILLINAGMTPMKPYFIGTEVPPCRRVTTSQKCIRTPDIDRVGLTARHGTYFEMLGNFSFGDYFKEEAITWAWEFITTVLKLPEERLLVSVYKDDDEAFDIWNQKMGLDAKRIFKMGKEDNFWEHGTGPCGPCSEIHYDRGPEFGCGKLDCQVGCECDRYLEFWNLVFSQFDRQEDGTYLPMIHKNIDTGGGLERFACLMQGVDNLFEVDTVRRILDTVCQIAKARYGNDYRSDVAIRVITDHIRSTTMMISDGVLPSNEGRGYVLRRLLRRAARYGRLLGIDKQFLTDLVPVVINESMGAYPELKNREDYILKVVENEEERFEKTVRQGSQLLDSYIDDAKTAGKSILAGDLVFKLHDTYGFPLDLTKEIAREQGLEVDEDGFHANMKKQKEEARAALKARGGSAWDNNALPNEVAHSQPTKFLGYEVHEADSVIEFIIGEGEDGNAQLMPFAGVDDEVIIVTLETPFYARAGGQIGDEGLIKGADDLIIKVTDTTKTAEGVYLHHAKIISGIAKVKAEVHLAINMDIHMETARNHTATHLVHKALRMVLGTHVTQAGSYVGPDRLRFDFNHIKPCTYEELRAVEKVVNDAILADYISTTEIMTLEEARKSGALALFDGRYGETVRVMSIGDFSKELCGGTHLHNTAQTGLFHILSEGSVASGVRRIEAVTGKAALEWVNQTSADLDAAAESLKVKPDEVVSRIAELQQALREETKKLQTLQSEIAKAQLADITGSIQTQGDVKYLVCELVASSADELRELAETLRDKENLDFVLVGSIITDKVNFVSMAGPNAIAKNVKCGDLIKVAAKIAGGGGGGRPDMAQAGGKNPDKLPQALQAVREELTAKLV